MSENSDLTDKKFRGTHFVVRTRKEQNVPREVPFDSPLLFNTGDWDILLVEAG